MTDAQIFQWLGLSFFAIGAGMLTNPKFIKDILKDFLDSTANMFFGGLVCLAIGLPLVTFHNVWNWDASLIITLLGWLALIKGLLFLAFPTWIIRMYKVVITKESESYMNYGVLALGIILFLLGYFA